MLIVMLFPMTCGICYGRCRLSMLVQFWVEIGGSNFDFYWRCELHVHDVGTIVIVIGIGILIGGGRMITSTASLI